MVAAGEIVAVAVVIIFIFKFLLEGSGKKRIINKGEERKKGGREEEGEREGGREGYVNYRGCVKRWA